MLDVKNIYKSFNKTHILEDVSFKVKQKEIITIIGASGCGKSTLLRLLIGLENADRGQIFIHDQELNSQNLYAIRRQVLIMWLFLFGKG